MRLYRIDRPADRRAALSIIGSDPGGAAVMAQKMEVLLFRIEAMPVAAANILKQDALSVGADLAVPRGTVQCAQARVRGLLMGTPRQLARLARKQKAQPFGLAAVGEALMRFLTTESEAKVKIMGVINANDDSFYPGSRFSGSAAVAAIERMIEEGADIVDIGAVSSRPGSKPVPEEEELARLAPLFEAIARARLGERVRLSIDTYRPAVAEAALQSGFGIVNDITGLADAALGEAVADHGATLVIMHMQGTPETMQQNPRYDDTVAEVADFFEERLARAEGVGIPAERVWLDVGIGFGKRLEDNLTLLKNLAHFRQFGCELLVGASRKSMIDAVIPAPVEARLPGTLAIHLEAVRRGATIVRCHDVAEHVQALALQQAIEEAKTV